MPQFQNSLEDFNLTEEALNDSRVRQVLVEFLGSDSMTSPTMKAVLISVYSLISLTALFTNSAILTVIVRTKKLCVPTHLLLLNLMIADLLLSTVCMPFTLISFLRKSWPFGWICCKIIPLIQGTAVFATSITIAVIAADRWYQITAGVPVINNKYIVSTFSRKKLFLEVALIWIVSVCFALPMAVYQVETEIGFPGILSYPKCIENWPNHSFGFYSLMVLFIQLIIPMTCLLLSFFKIRSHLQQNLEKILPGGGSPHREMIVSLKMGNSEASTLTTVEEVSKSGSEQNVAQQETQRKRILREMERNRRVTNTLLTVSASFIICWMPWNAINIIMDFNNSLISSDVAYALLATCHVVAMSSVVVNPVLYGYTNTNIRRELRFRSTSPDSSS